MQFKALLSDAALRFPVEFKWSAHNGQIIGGQGTAQVLVAWPDCDKNVTVTLEYSGLPEGCNGKNSETAGLSHCGNTVATLVDEMAGTYPTLGPSSRLRIITAVRQNPESLIYVVLKYRKSAASTVPARKRQILRWWNTSEMRNRPLRFAEVLHTTNSTEFWHLPPGAELPPVSFRNSGKKDGYVTLWLVPPGADLPEN